MWYKSLIKWSDRAYTRKTIVITVPPFTKSFFGFSGDMKAFKSKQMWRSSFVRSTVLESSFGVHNVLDGLEILLFTSLTRKIEFRCWPVCFTSMVVRWPPQFHYQIVTSNLQLNIIVMELRGRLIEYRLATLRRWIKCL